ncbi:hypothetical protein PF007_g28287 [Phytophthora fragariae]|uniref:ZSWIM1/3 RNaseH-like domain-containing protein n=4 Tax=Phytophthora fragariae TaxID=53985 RepID=A0A6A3Q1E8_9STRA|nr:hypothetical protein PF007_g28287 [Phytophthora fragariae]
MPASEKPSSARNCAFQTEIEWFEPTLPISRSPVSTLARRRDRSQSHLMASIRGGSELGNDSNEEGISETAPRFAKWHDTWENFFDSLRQYEARTAQLYRIRSCTKVTARNDKIKKKKKWSKTEQVPEEFGDYYKKLLCTHGWEKNARGDGRRTGHHNRSTGCTVNLSATVSRCPASGTWWIYVSTHRRTHNHRLRREVYENYPSTRRVTDPSVLDFVDELVKAGSKPKKILKYLQETTGKRVILRDVHNLVHRLKVKRRGTDTVEERLEAVLRKFCASRGNNASIFVDETKTTQTITMQTRQMGRFFEAFPEVVMLDSTHGTNSSKCKLISFMIDDAFGHRYLRTEMSKAIYSGRHAVDVDRVEDSVDMMMKARNQEEYDRGLRYMYYILDGFDDTGDLPEPKHPLLDYFVRNWHSCKEMWAVYERGHVAHLGNHTNNRLESAWGALKDILNPEMELDECVETLYFLQSTAELEYASRFNVLGSRIYHGADEMLLRLAVLVSPHAFELIRKEYELFKNGSLSYEGRWIQDKIVHMRSHATGGEYTVNTSTFVCSCFFMRTMLLPWHHAMFVRSSMNKKKVIPIIYIHARWLLQSEVNRPEEDESDDDISCAAFRVQASHMRSVEHAVLNGSSKWKTGMDIAAGVVEAMCSQGTPTFVKMAEALRGFGECARRGAVPIISVDPPCSERAVERVVEVTSEEDRPEVQNQMPDNDDTDVILTDTSTVPPTLKTTQTSDSVCMSDHNSDVVEDFAVEVEIEATTSYSASVHAADEDDGGGDIAADIRSLIAETERIINRANEMVSSDGERSDSQSKLPDRTKKTYNLATKARVNRKELPVKAVVKEKKRYNLATKAVKVPAVKATQSKKS